MGLTPEVRAEAVRNHPSGGAVLTHVVTALAQSWQPRYRDCKFDRTKSLHDIHASCSEQQSLSSDSHRKPARKVKVRIALRLDSEFIPEMQWFAPMRHLQTATGSG